MEMVAISRETLGFPPLQDPKDDWFAEDVPVLSDEELKHQYEEMLVMRRLEEQAGKAYGKGKISGFCHLYIGQEAVTSGTRAATRDDDYWISAYRDHAQALAKGISANAIMAELFGKATGCSKGKGGSMHMYSAEKNFLGGDGIVGGQIPIAAGVGWAIKYRKEDRVCVCFFGDAAANQGVFHEALNMACLWKLPVIFICENNLYGMGTAISRTSASGTIAQRATGYDMAQERVDGQHFFRMYEAVARAAKRAREDGMPTLIEAVCYRFKGHSMSDPGTYRTRDEVDDFRSRDPLKVLKEILVARDIIDDAWAKDADKKAKAIATESVKFADESPLPPMEWMYTDVLIEDEEGSDA